MRSKKSKTLIFAVHNHAASIIGAVIMIYYFIITLRDIVTKCCY